VEANPVNIKITTNYIYNSELQKISLSYKVLSALFNFYFPNIEAPKIVKILNLLRITQMFMQKGQHRPSLYKHMR